LDLDLQALAGFGAMHDDAVDLLAKGSDGFLVGAERIRAQGLMKVLDLLAIAIERRRMQGDNLGRLLDQGKIGGKLLLLHFERLASLPLRRRR
jgi:hypothetical protein